MRSLTKSSCCLLLTAALLVSGCSRARTKSPIPQIPPTQNIDAAETNHTIPAGYQGLYSTLKAKLESLDSYLNTKLSGTKYGVTYGAELLPANGNQGESLLTEKTYQGTTLYLDHLQSIGVKGVKVAISYPLLTPDFPHREGYLNFYQKVAQEIRRRNMTMLAGVGPVFSGTAFSDLTVDFSGLTLARYREGLRQQVEVIIKEICPDYITIANEPTTLGWVTGLKVSAADFTETVNYVLSGLDRGDTLIGAGTGTWDDLDYIRSLASSTNLDYIDIHIYPINLDFFERALTIADIATASHKRLAIGEAWLYKVEDAELNKTSVMATQADIFGRDAFGFWEPLDVRFLELVDRLARYKHFEFVSFFWSKYLFSYLDYEKTAKGISYRELVSISNSEAVRNMLANKCTRTGLVYQTLAAQETPSR